MVSQNKYRPERYGAQRGSWKLIHDFVDDRSSLFDLATDSGETVDRALEHPERVATLRRALDARRAAWQRAQYSEWGPEHEPEDALDPDARRRLEALGYIH